MFLLLGPLEPVILWTGAQEKAEWKRGGVESLVSGVRSLSLSLCTEEESEASAPNSAHAPTVREDPNLCESVKMGSTTATDLGRGHLPRCGA